MQLIKIMINHLNKECYFKVGNSLLLQCRGIPMGIDPASLWAYLHLNNQSTVIKACDKGGGIRIMNIKDYLSKIHTHTPARLQYIQTTHPQPNKSISQ